MSKRKTAKKASTTSPTQWVTERKRDKYRLGHPWETTHVAIPSRGIRLLVHYSRNQYGLKDHYHYNWNLHVHSAWPMNRRFGNHFLGDAKTLKEAKNKMYLAYIAYFVQILIGKEKEHPWTDWDERSKEKDGV